MEITGAKLTLILSVGLIVFLIVVNGTIEPNSKEEVKKEKASKEAKIKLGKNQKLAVRVIARPSGENYWSFILQKVKLPKDVIVRGGREKEAGAGLKGDEKRGIEVVSESSIFPLVGGEDKSHHERKQLARKIAKRYTARFNGRRYIYRGN